MRYALPTLLFCAGLAVAAPVPEKPALPSGPAPHFVVVEVRDGNFVLTTLRYVCEERVVTVKQGNDTVLRKEIVQIPIMMRQELKGASVKVFDADGTLVPTADAAARLREATLVLLSADGKLVDPAYRALLNRKVLILVTAEADAPNAVRPMTDLDKPKPDLAPPPPPLPPGK
jgi:hypothetical protein